jgi:N-acetylmuramoyl-L-alanine amidase
MGNYHFLLDAGHGGMVNGVYVTPGKRSPVWEDGRQLFEGVFNRMVVRELAQLCQNAGIQCTNIVPEEQDISLGERVRRANQIARTSKCVYLSIHANAGGGTGWEIWTTVGQTKSDIIADIFFLTAKQHFPMFKMRANMTDGDFDQESNFYVLRETICPAVLTENFFMDTLNPDCEFLMSQQGVTAIAQMHFAAIQQIEATQPI